MVKVRVIRMSRSARRTPSTRQKRTKIGTIGMDISTNRLGTKNRRNIMTRRPEIGGEKRNKMTK